MHTALPVNVLVNTGLANGCRQAPREPLGERESQCARGPAVPHRLVAPCVSTAPACVCSLRRRILLGPLSRPAALGQADKAFFSPRCVHTGDQAEACLTEKGTREQPSPLLVSAGDGVAAATESPACGWHTGLPTSGLQVCVALGLTRCSSYKGGWLLPAFPLLLGTDFQCDSTSGAAQAFCPPYLYLAKRSGQPQHLPSFCISPTPSPAAPHGLSCP